MREPDLVTKQKHSYHPFAVSGGTEVPPPSRFANGNLEYGRIDQRRDAFVSRRRRP